jgi:hypothetical protein
LEQSVKPIDRQGGQQNGRIPGNLISNSSANIFRKSYEKCGLLYSIPPAALLSQAG